MPLQFSPIVRVHVYDKEIGTLMRPLGPNMTLEGAQQLVGHICTPKGRRLTNVVKTFLYHFRHQNMPIKTLKVLKTVLKNGGLQHRKKPIKTKKEFDKLVKGFLSCLRRLPSSDYTCTQEKVLCKSIDDLRIWAAEGLEIFRKPRRLPRPSVNVRVSNLRIEEQDIHWSEQRPNNILTKSAPIEKILACHFYVNI